MLEHWNPIGTVGVITAFNFPVAVLGWNLALSLVGPDKVNASWLYHLFPIRADPCALRFAGGWQRAYLEGCSHHAPHHVRAGLPTQFFNFFPSNHKRLTFSLTLSSIALTKIIAEVLERNNVPGAVFSSVCGGGDVG